MRGGAGQAHGIVEIREAAEQHVDTREGIEYVLRLDSGRDVTLVQNRESDETPLPPGTLALGVPDVAEAKATLEAAGVEVNEMWDSGVCHGAGLRDPAGNAILLHHRYAPYGPR